MAATNFPFTLTTLGNLKDANLHQPRFNFKNDGTYSVASGFTPSGTGIVVQGYSSSPGDGGRATMDGSTLSGIIITSTGIAGNIWADIIFSTSITSGSTSLVTADVLTTFERCVFTGSRIHGLAMTVVGSVAIECEAYANNKSNTAGGSGFFTNQSSLVRCISHNNTGSGTSGIVVAAGICHIQNCIVDTNGQYGISSTSTSRNGAIIVSGTDVYNNTSDGINIITGGTNPHWIENCNFIKNGGAGINNVSTVNAGYSFNCGYGSGTQANGSADTLNNLAQTGKVTYASGVTPWVSPSTGDFRVNLPAAINAGRGAFTQTAAAYGNASMIGYPDIGAVQHYDTQKGHTFGG